MKIRIKDNSVRYRLTQTEVKHLCDTHSISTHTQFPNQEFCYKVILKDNIENLNAHFEKACITLEVPKNLAKDWYENDVVGFQHDLPLENGASLSLLLEKDFVCLDNTIEDQSDNYPNPKLQH